MGAIWNRINNFNINDSVKNRLFIMLMCILYGMAGGVVWLIIGRAFLPEVYWGLCFIGYPVVLGGLFGGILYLYNHEFDKKEEKE
ncbi:MAG: hypothetical protein ACI4KL_02725 [Lentihominibacter sp.]